MHFPATHLRQFCAFLLASILWLGVSWHAAQGQVLITEFMAANVRTLADRDREYADWIELFNPGSAAASLEGWFLTDDRKQLDKWKFPAVTLGPGEYLVVFASKKDRRVAGADMHTNFKLDAGRGYLALVKPDGTGVASQFEYPRQVAGASYGVPMAEQPTRVISSALPKRFHVPTADVGMKWAAAEFDDAAWPEAGGAIAFGADGSAALRERMLNKSASAYVRVPFDLKDTALDSLKLRMRADDGFVAYLNGREVARTNAPARPAWNSTAPAARAAGGAPVVMTEQFYGAGAKFVTSQLDPSTTPKAFPEDAVGAGGLRLLNGRLDNQVNGVTFPQAVPGLFETIVADFDFRWKTSGEGTERVAFLLIPVGQYGASGPGVDLATVRDQKDAKFPGVLAVQLLHNPVGSQKALTVYWDRAKVTSVDLPSNLFGQRMFHHAQIRIARAGQGTLLSVVLTSDVRGPAKTVHAALSPTLISGLQPFQPRVQFVARAGSLDQTLDLAEVRVEFQGAGAQRADEFDLSGFLNVLRPGRNVLAIHGLNHSATDPTFRIEPELIAGSSAVKSRESTYFATPTPRAANRAGTARLAPPPVFSRRGGVIKEPVTLELSAASGTVRYTLDGSEPSANAEAYSQPITLTGSTLVRARTFAPDAQPSATSAETFTVLDETATAFRSNLPLLILNPFGQHISQGGRTPASVQLIEPDKGGMTTLAGKMDYEGRGTLNVRGFSTLRQPKNSLTLRLVDENNDKTKVSLLGLPKESDWVLYAPYVDKTLMRDALAYELSNDMGRYAPRTRFVEVFIDRSGGKLSRRDYMGVYVLVEKIKRGKGRVDIAELSASDTGEPAITGGYIFKRDHSDRYEPSFRTSRGNQFFYVEPDPKEMSREQMTWLSRYMGRFEQALYGEEFRSPSKGYAAFLDVDAFIDQHWLIEMSKNIDGFRYSAFLYKDRGGKLVTGPAWDWNLSFGNANYYDASDPSGWYTEQLRDSEICWFRRLSEDPEFMQRTIDRWGELRRSVFSSTRILARVDEIAAQLNEAQGRNFSRWPVLGRRVHPNDYVGDTYEDEVKWMKQWIQKRLAWIDSQFPAPPVVTQADGNTTLRAASGKVYFTLDGSDPRSPGGGVSPKAQVYSAPIPSSTSAKLAARAQQRNGWSAPVSVRATDATRSKAQGK